MEQMLHVGDIVEATSNGIAFKVNGYYNYMKGSLGEVIRVYSGGSSIDIIFADYGFREGCSADNFIKIGVGEIEVKKSIKRWAERKRTTTI